MRIPAIEVGNGATIPYMDHFAEYGFYDVNPDGGFLQPAPPFRFHPPLPGVESRRRPPGPLGPIRTAPRPAPPARAVRPPPPIRPGRPFEGLRVADFTSFWAGPFLTHTMAMFGADVIHIESDGAARRRPADGPLARRPSPSGGSGRRTSTPRTPTSAASPST